MNIVIISRYIYPVMAPRPLRATELAKELSQQGHRVTLYGYLGAYDYSNFEKQYNLKVKSLGRFFNPQVYVEGKSRSIIGWKRKIVNCLNKFLEFPDIIISRSVYKSLEKEEKIDMLITVAIPYPIHWGAAYAKKHLKQLKNTMWVSDCGDPYMGSLMSKHPFYFKYVEKYWCRQTNYISVPVEQAKNGYYKEFRDKIIVIPQGFSYENVELSTYVKNTIHTFCYSGMVYPNSRDPRRFLDYLCSLNISFKFIVYTNKQDLFFPYTEKLADKIEIRNYIPHDDLLKELSKMDFLINIRNESAVQQPSKLIDYYLSKRPILEISSAFNEQKVFNEFLEGNYANQLKCSNIEDYNIITVANKFVSLYKKTE